MPSCTCSPAQYLKKPIVRVSHKPPARAPPGSLRVKAAGQALTPAAPAAAQFCGSRLAVLS
eukprot:365574-Chlamydomonas_euryale.AAC.12